MAAEDFAASIREDDDLSSTRLVVSMPTARRGDTDKLKDAGFDAYLLKPIRRNSLQRHIVEGMTDIVVDDAGATVATVDAPAEVAAGPLRIILAEDNEINQMLALALLGKKGHQVTAVVNGAEAVEAAQSGDFDVVLMDIHMPEVDGLEATRQIRGLDEKGPDLPIIALTANAMAEDKQMCLDAGMDDYLAKPINEAELNGALEHWRPGRTAGPRLTQTWHPGLPRPFPIDCQRDRTRTDLIRGDFHARSAASRPLGRPRHQWRCGDQPSLFDAGSNGDSSGWRQCH